MFRRNGLTIVAAALFLAFLAGQVLTGARTHNDERKSHGEDPLGLPAYLVSGHFFEATAENWESEFLQMASYVILTVFLFQKGSSESKDPDRAEKVGRHPRAARGKLPSDAPWPVRRGGLRARNEEALAHGESIMDTWEYLGSARIWFESFQNWQSEFLSLVAMVWLSIYLRQRGSPESKPVDAPHSQTGKG
ncbi:MAG: DUF6766 family protein [Steroidobacteraceae bacterium]